MLEVSGWSSGSRDTSIWSRQRGPSTNDATGPPRPPRRNADFRKTGPGPGGSRRRGPSRKPLAPAARQDAVPRLPGAVARVPGPRPADGRRCSRRARHRAAPVPLVLEKGRDGRTRGTGVRVHSRLVTSCPRPTPSAPVRESEDSEFSRPPPRGVAAGLKVRERESSVPSKADHSSTGDTDPKPPLR